MLSTRSRRLTYAAAALFALVGAVLFVAPGWAAAHFPWRVSPFLAMTMGGWYLGAALFAGAGARDGSWTRSHAALLFAWVFGLGQGALLLVHADVLDMGAGLAWPYAAALAVAALAAVSGAFDVVRERPERERGGRPVRRWVRGLVAGFVVAVGLLALPLVDGYDSPGSIWPGELTLLSARAFAVFFGALSLSALALLLGRSYEPMVVFLRVGVVVSGLILAAAGVYLDRFDFGEHPGQWIYVGLYVVVGAASLAILAAMRRSHDEVRPLVRAR